MAEIRQGSRQSSAMGQARREEPTTERGMTRTNESGTGGGMGGMEVERAGLITGPMTYVRRFVSDFDRMLDRLLDDIRLGAQSAITPRYGEATARPRWSPAADVFERDGQLVLLADIPGLRQEDVRVTVDDNVLTIAGERSHEHEHEKGGVYQCERSYGKFQRRVALPEGVTPESIRATFENGVLEVTMPMPKQPATKGRSVPIQSTRSQGITH
jgi:HSP20 family protein